MVDSRCGWECPEDFSQWSDWLAAGLHARNRWRLPVLLVGILFATGRRTVTTWLRAAGVSPDFQDYYYFLDPLGRNAKIVAERLVALLLVKLPLPPILRLVIDDSPTKRYGPKVEGADIHHNPTPGPADQTYLYGHIWVTMSLALRHPVFGAVALPLRAMLYVRERTIATIPAKRGWKFATKLVLAARLVQWIMPMLKSAGKAIWIVVDGGYTKKPFLRPVGGVIRVVIVKEAHTWHAFFSTDPNVTAVEILEAFADRATIEQDFHDVKEVWGAGQQQVRNIWTNVAVYHLNLWMHTLVELWAWDRPHHELCDRRDSPWDDADRRPSHANRRKALRRAILQKQLSQFAATKRLPKKFLELTQRLLNLAA